MMNQVLGTTFLLCVFHSYLSVVSTKKKEFCTVEWQQMALGSLSQTKSLQNHPYTTHQGLQLIAPTFLPSNYAKKRPFIRHIFQKYGYYSYCET